MIRRRLPWLAALFFLAQVPLFHGYVTDDSYIYARFADNLAQRGELSFNPGEPVHAATSPLWAALGALASLMGVPSLVSLRWMGILAGAAAVFVGTRAASRVLGSTSSMVVAFALVLATEPWLLRWSSSAMETGLAALLVVVALEATLRPVAEVAARRAALAVGLLPLVRPEALLLVVLFGIHVLRTPSLRRRFDVYFLALAPFLVWSGLALAAYGHVLPETMRAKSTPLGLQFERLVGNLRVLAVIFAIGAALPTLIWFASLLREPKRVSRIDERWWGAAAWWQWTLALPVVYVVRDVQVISRYLEIVLPAIILLAGICIAATELPRRWARAFAAQALLALGLTVVWIAPNARAFGTSLDRGLGDIADWLRTSSPPGATVAIYDIGLVGHRSDRRILDLGGLIHPGVNALRDRVDDATILAEGLFLDFERPDYLVDRAFEAAPLDGHAIRNLRLRALMSREVANLGLSRARPVIYTLYEVMDP